jgi:hypothetical protein
VMVSAVQPMSDLPAAALWLLAWTCSVQPGLGAASAGGAAVAAAVLIRPNLAPLALVPGLCALVGPAFALQWHRGLVFAAVAALGPVLTVWAQAVLFGGPFTPGYREWQTFYRAANIPVNLDLVARNITAVHSLLVWPVLVVPLAYVGRQAATAAPDGARVAWSALALLVLTVALYLPYQPYPDLHYLRFFLPAIGAGYVLLAGGSVWLWRRLGRASRWLAPLALVPALVVAAWPGALHRYPLGLHRTQARVPVMGRYLEAAIPRHAVVLAHLHGTAVTHYTGRPIVRLDLIDPSALDGIVDDLVRAGHVPVLVLSEADEAVAFPGRFAASRYRALDWPPRARAIDESGLLYWVLEDRARAAAGGHWPVDVLRGLP